MVASVQSALAAGDYTKALQLALGPDASAQIKTVNGKDVVTITGTPVGASTAPIAPAIARGVDSVSLSPAAQTYLSNASIALAVIDSIVSKGDLGAKTAQDNAVQATTPPAASNIVSGVATVSAGTSASPDSTSDADSAALQDLSPTDLINGIVQAAKAATNDPDYYYNQVNFTPGLLGELVSSLGNQGASFQAAFESRSLSVTNVDAIPALESANTAILTGVSETTGDPTDTIDINGVDKALGLGGGSLVSEFEVSGSLYVTWGPLAAANTTLAT